jgi:hypothetical protein
MFGLLSDGKRTVTGPQMNRGGNMIRPHEKI